jgi:ComF family protein
MPTGNLAGVNPKLWVYRGFWTVVDWIYPPSCAGCEKFGERWCADCTASVQILRDNLCPKCGLPEPHNLLCARCQVLPPPFTAIRGWGLYNGSLRTAIHRLKYRHDLGLAEALSKHLIDHFQTLAWPIDLITAVPLSSGRLSERGYNQSVLLAYPLALATRVPFHPAVIYRIRETTSQVGLSADDRHENVRDAFAAIPELAYGKTVLIIDDVATTGATLKFCAAALLLSGARAVYGLTLARAGQVDYHEKTV